MRDIKFAIIGYAKNNVKTNRVGNFADEITEIILDDKYKGALKGIEDYSHVIIIYVMDKVKDFVISHVPQGKEGVPDVGIFACRCPRRPNPIAMTTVPLLKVKDNSIKVKGLDIIDGTPVLDIKPYWPQYDAIDGYKIPDWVNKLEF